MKHNEAKEYETPTVEIIVFGNDDVITASNETPGMPYSLMHGLDHY